jgi:hypothetical protein
LEKLGSEHKVLRDRAPFEEACLVRVDQLRDLLLQPGSEELDSNFYTAILQTYRPEISDLDSTRFLGEEDHI